MVKYLSHIIAFIKKEEFQLDRDIPILYLSFRKLIFSVYGSLSASRCPLSFYREAFK